MDNSKIHTSSLSTKAKNTIADYYWLTIGGKKIYKEINFSDVEPVNLTQISKLRNVGVITIKEVTNFCKENNINYKPYKKPIHKRGWNKKQKQHA